jgi:glucan-binding YG repeat protein
MRHNELKKVVIMATLLCITSVPVVAHAQDARINKEITRQNEEVTQQTEEITQQKEIKIGDNWLTREVAKQLSKEVRELSEQDFLNVKKIDFKSEKINDTLPDEIMLLKNLEYLDLNYCGLSGQVPEALGNLPNLTYLDLGSNQLTELPYNIKQKIANGKYAYCDVEGNKFTLDEGWYYLKGKLCYINGQGEKLKGDQIINGKEYEFTEDGTVIEAWETDKDGNMFYSDGQNGIVKNDWKLLNDKWYYFNEKGIMQRGFQTIKGVQYYLDENGIMLKYWQKINDKWYYFNDNGGMVYGWLTLNNKTYYMDPSTGIMVDGDQTIDGKKYRFSSNGDMLKNVWIDTYTYIKPDGESVNTYYNYSHSNTNYQLFKYMTYPNNEASVDSTAVTLHGGITSNNCVYFTSEALRRIGVNIPTSTANTYQLENVLKSMGFAYSYDFSQIKPGDIVFTNNYTHVYIFMGWDKDGYAYIVDNQGSMYGGTLHRRLVLQDTEETDRATHFFYYPN